MCGMPEFIETLYNHFTNLPVISSQEKNYIQEDGSLNLIRMVRKYPHDPYLLPTRLGAININPELPLHILKRIVCKTITQ